MTPFLSIKKVTKNFGGLVAVSDLDLDIEKGQILGLIGPNGAGKSTAFNCVAGLYVPTAGQIFYNGEDVTGMNPWTVCKKGIGRTFQLVKPFHSKTVLYNVMVGSFCRTNIKKEAEEYAREIIDFIGLSSKVNAFSKNLTISDRKKLELARAMATKPDLLLMDEVMAGLRPSEVEEMMNMVKNIRKRGVTIFLIEHIMQAVMNLSDRIVVIHYGKKIAEGTPREVAKDEKVIKAYLGDEYAIA